MDINWKVPKTDAELPVIPLSALTKIGTALSESTSGKIEYQIVRQQKNDGHISHSFYIAVPSLQDFRLLAIETAAPITGYPVKIYDFLNAKNTSMDLALGRNFVSANTPTELTNILKTIVESNQSALVIGSLLAEIGAQADLTTDNFGRMRPKR